MNTKPAAVAVLILAAMVTVARAQETPAAGGARSAAPAAPQDAQPGQQRGPTTLAQAWTTALATMRAQKAPGLVFVLPPADATADPAAVKAAKERFHSKLMGGTPVDAKTARELLLLHVQLLRQDVGAAFGLAVPVVATAAAAGAKPGETLVLLSEDGKRTAGFTVDLADAAAVASALQPHLFAPERLTVRRANVPPAVTAAVRDLADVRKRLPQEQDAERQQALLQRQQELLAQLQAQLFAAAPALHEAPTNNPMRRGAADADLLGELLQWTTPLGTEVGATWDPCPPCGMMAMPMPFRSALKLLAQ